jgi:hypothetical protein
MKYPYTLLIKETAIYGPQEIKTGGRNHGCHERERERALMADRERSEHT